MAQLREQFPAIATILLNVNAKNTNVILGSETHPLYGPGYLEDTLCGVPVRLGPLSFYQVNTLAAEQLYGIAAQYAQLTPDEKDAISHRGVALAKLEKELPEFLK